MRFLFFLSLLVFVFPGQGQSYTAMETAVMQSGVVSITEVGTATVSGPASQFWWYIPWPVRTTYSRYYVQEPISATLTTSPPAALVPLHDSNGEVMGYWAYFGDVNNAELRFSLESVVNVSINLPGMPRDVVRGGSITDPWYRPTVNCPIDMPGFAAFVDNLYHQTVPGTDQTTWGFLLRLASWMHSNITYNSSLTLDENSADKVWSRREAGCAGFTNFAKAALLALPPPHGPVGSGVTLGYVAGNNAIYPVFGTGTGLSISFQPGGHAWLEVDDNTELPGTFIPSDITGGTAGFVNLAYVTRGTFEDIEDGNSVIAWAVGDPVVRVNFSVTGSAAAGTFVGRDKSSYPTTGKNFACQWIRGATVGVEEKTGKILDRSKENTLCAWLNPVSVGNWVDFQLYLEKPSHVLGRVFSADGRLKKIVVDSELPAEYNYFSLQTGDMASGIYFLRLSLNNGKQVETQKFQVVH